MPEEKRIKMAMLVGFISFVLLLIRWIVNKNKVSKKAKFAEKAKANGCVKTARAVSRKVNAGTGDISDPERMLTKVFVKYAYVVNGKEYTKSVMYKEGWSTSTDYPSEITVFYDKNNPKKAYSHFEVNASSAAQQGKGCATAIFLPMAITAVVFWLLEFIS